MSARPRHAHPDILVLAQALHASVRAVAGLEPCWASTSSSLKEFYVRMAYGLDDRRAEFFGVAG